MSQFGSVRSEVRVLSRPPGARGARLQRALRPLVLPTHVDERSVQPPDPLDLWDSEPFDPQVREGTFYARGVADNKGDLLARLQAIEAYQAILGELIRRFAAG